VDIHPLPKQPISLAEGGTKGLKRMRFYQDREVLAELKFVGPFWRLRISNTVPPLRMRRVSKQVGMRTFPLSRPNHTANPDARKNGARGLP